MLQPFASTVYALIEQFLTTYVYVRTFVAAMAQANEQPDKRQLLLCADADGAEQYLHPNQPGRILAQQISWLHHGDHSGNNYPRTFGPNDFFGGKYATNFQKYSP